MCYLSAQRISENPKKKMLMVITVHNVHNDLTASAVYLICILKYFEPWIGILFKTFQIFITNLI